MRTIVRIPSILRSTLGEALYQSLRAVYSQESGDRGFTCILPDTDARVLQVLSLLKDAGFEPWRNDFRKRQQHEFWLELDREYEEGDFVGINFVCPMPKYFWDGLWRSPDGYIELDRGQYRSARKKDFFHTQIGCVVSTRAKSVLENAGLRHLVFKPTVLTDRELEPKPVPWEKYGAPFWELTSDLLLPRLSPTCTLLDNDGQPVRDDFNNGCFLKEDLYSMPELHYRAADLAAAPEFDFARTFEMFGIHPSDNNRLAVASARFREVCMQNDIKLDWIPVRIDP